MRNVLLFLFVFFFSILYSQDIRVVRPNHNLYEQGIAIYNNYGFLLYDKGFCRILDLKTHQIINEFELGCYGAKNHANCASFGREKIKGNSIPLLYVSQCRSPKFLCFVENVTEEGATLVQTIRSGCEGEDSIAHNWVINAKNNSIYTISTSNIRDSIGNKKHHIVRFRLPRLSEGREVVLNEGDIKEKYDVYFPNLLQGAIIKGKYLYLPTGRNQSQNKMKDAERLLIVVNLKSHKIERKIDLTSITNNEPEDCDFYRGKLLLYCGQSGGLYEIPTK